MTLRKVSRGLAPRSAEADQIEQPGEHALLGEDQLPAIDAHQIIGPERQHDRDIEHRLRPRSGEAGHIIGKRKGDRGTAQGHHGRHDNRAQDDGEIGGGEELGISGERGLIDDEAGEIVDREEALGEEGQQRTDIDDAEPEQRRQQQEEQHQPRAEIEEGGDPPDGTRARRRTKRGRLGDGAHCRISWIWARCQMSRTAWPWRASAVEAVSSRFWSMTVSSPPPASATWKRVEAPR